MTLGELVEQLNELQKYAPTLTNVELHKHGPSGEIKAIWIGLSGVIYLSNVPDKPNESVRQN